MSFSDELRLISEAAAAAAAAVAVFEARKYFEFLKSPRRNNSLISIEEEVMFRR